MASCPRPGQAKTVSTTNEPVTRLPSITPANVNGVIKDGPVEGYLQGPPSHWIEELQRLHGEFRFDGFVLWADGDMVEQIGRFAAEVAPAVAR